MIQSPFHSLDPLTLVLRRGRQAPDGDARPVVMVMEVEQLEIADEDGNMGGRGPGQGLGPGLFGLFGLHYGLALEGLQTESRR